VYWHLPLICGGHSTIRSLGASIAVVTGTFQSLSSSSLLYLHIFVFSVRSKRFVLVQKAVDDKVRDNVPQLLAVAVQP
jgi:hypothetical protein